MRTAPRAALAAYRGHDARPQGDFLRLPSLLASRPTVVEPVPGRAVYHAAWSMPRTPPNDVYLHAPPSFMLCVRQGMGVAAFTAPSCSLDGKGAVLWTGGACRWRAPRPSLPVALASRMGYTLPWLEARNQHAGGLSRGRQWTRLRLLVANTGRRVTCGTAVNDALQLPDAGAEARAG